MRLPGGWLASSVLEMLPFLRTHYVAAVHSAASAARHAIEPLERHQAWQRQKLGRRFPSYCQTRPERRRHRRGRRHSALRLAGLRTRRRSASSSEFARVHRHQARRRRQLLHRRHAPGAAGGGIGPGDEVITSPLTFPATANVIVHCGATPVLADICADDLHIDPERSSATITPRTKAIMPVHYARPGLPHGRDLRHRAPPRPQGHRRRGHGGRHALQGPARRRPRRRDGRSASTRSRT